jgi:hypothetical protein
MALKVLILQRFSVHISSVNTVGKLHMSLMNILAD